jgi:peroxiredoxin
VRLQEQIQLHQQRANIQDKKIKKLQHEYELSKLQNYKFETKEFDLEEQLETQTKICQETTKELHTSTKEIEKLSSICANLQEQQEKMEQTWCDNARLTQILASLGQYKDLVQEMHDEKGLVYLPPTSRGAKILVSFLRVYLIAMNVVKSKAITWIPKLNWINGYKLKLMTCC